MTIKIIAEIGINHNGDLEIAKKLINVAAAAGCDYAKFQKRNPDLCVPEAQKNKLRQTPWGEMKYIDYKWKIEFGKDEFDQIDTHCKNVGIEWFASVWDLESVKFMRQYTNLAKIPSALIVDEELLKAARKANDLLIISTGMSTENEIERAVNVGNPDVIMHTNSSYPSKVDELNLNYITHLREKYNKEVGYSGHEYGLATTTATVALGATWIERHLTIDRRMWGSDQEASVEPAGFCKLVRAIRNVQLALGSAGERVCSGAELEKRNSLRGT